MSSTPRAQADSRLLARIWPYARADAALFGFGMLLTPLTLALGLAQPWLLKRAIDQHIMSGELEGLQLVAGGYLACIVLGYVVEAAYGVAMGIAGQRTVYRLREHIFRHLLGLSARFYDKRPAGELLTRATSDVESLGESLSSGVVTLVVDVMMVVGVLIAMFILEWRMTLLLLCLAPPLGLVIEICRRKLRVCFNLIRETLAKVNAYLAEQVSGMEIVQLFNDERRSVQGFIDRNTPYKDASVRSNVYDALMYAAVDGVGSICIGLMLWYASIDSLELAVSAGLVAAFIDYLNRLFRPLRQLSSKITIVQRALAALEKIFGLLDHQEHIGEGQGELPEASGHLVIRGLDFGYKAGEDVLHGIDLEIAPGEVVALVGPSGCGKTTLTRLLDRRYDGYRGSITLDGQELSGLPLETVRKNVAAVSQDIQLFPETVRFNVDLDNAAISEDRLLEAAQLANAKSFVEALPGSWSALLRDRGSNLSVGQGQLLTFARTLAYDSRVVILDEATASVDPVTEHLVQDAIARILERKTVLVVAHRLSTITAADRIVVLSRGRVVEQGTHAELLELGGAYAELHEAGFDDGVELGA